ncbi:hypothetical protein AGMMS49983_07080 [Clostridia bacterium]|nr:hypothetical protein AGMMS49983_07080 [Clostridia bacterium]
MAASGFEILERLPLNGWKIYIDTCSLYRTTHENDEFWERFERLLEDNSKENNRSRFIITAATFSEIKKHKHNENHRANEDAVQLEQILAQFTKSKKDLMVTVGEPDEFHDNAIVAKIKERSLKFNQVYITNDLASAWDVQNSVFGSQSTTRNLMKLLIFKIVGNGDLAPHKELPYLSELTSNQQKEYFKLRSLQKYEEAEAFLVENTSFKPFVPGAGKEKRNKTTPNAQTQKEGKLKTPPILNPDYDMPIEGETVKAIRGSSEIDVVLTKKINRGGEGFIYSVDYSTSKTNTDGVEIVTEYLAKIYKKSKLYKTMDAAKQTLAKIDYIVHGKFTVPHVTFPQYILVNSENEFIGYLMRKVSGIQLSTFISDGSVKSEFINLYPNLKKLDLIEICQNFLQAIENLHAKDIIVGDLNANNILVDVNTNAVSIIDSDSYQYSNKFVCNVGVEKYTSPEFLKNHSNEFRTVQNELFVVARILCEILMMVDNPYNSKISEDPVKDMLAGNFRYTFAFDGDNRITNAEAPGDDLVTRWGQLTRQLKNSFGNTFHCDGRYWNPGNRLDAIAWKKMLNAYKLEIEKSIADGTGVVSNEVFPSEKRKWIRTCAQCQKPFTPRFDGDELCEECRKYTICDKCGEKLIKEFSSQTTCPECSNETIICKTCGTPFVYSFDQKKKDFSRGTPKPTECETCRTTKLCPDCKSVRIPKNQSCCDSCREIRNTKLCPYCNKNRIPKNHSYCDDCAEDIVEYRECVNCHKQFPISRSQKSWEERKNARIKQCDICKAAHCTADPCKHAVSVVVTKPAAPVQVKQEKPKSLLSRLFGL